MLWNDTVFRTINEARKLTAKEGSKEIGFNGPLLELFDQGYVTTQVMAIRRLTDPTFYDPKRAVISLPRLVDDMRQYGDLITRENYICFDGLAFEGVTHEKEGINWMHWNRMHENFDKLSGVSKTKRQRTDKIHPNIFNPLKNLDKPMVSKEHLSNLHSYWHDRVKEVGSWDNELWEIFKT